LDLPVTSRTSAIKPVHREAPKGMNPGPGILKFPRPSRQASMQTKAQNAAREERNGFPRSSPRALRKEVVQPASQASPASNSHPIDRAPQLAMSARAEDMSVSSVGANTTSNTQILPEYPTSDRPSFCSLRSNDPDGRNSSCPRSRCRPGKARIPFKLRIQAASMLPSLVMP